MTRTPVTARHTVTHRMVHFERDSGLTKFDFCPAGGGRAEVGWGEEAMERNEEES